MTALLTRVNKALELVKCNTAKWTVRLVDIKDVDDYYEDGVERLLIIETYESELPSI